MGRKAVRRRRNHAGSQGDVIVAPATPRALRKDGPTDPSLKSPAPRALPLPRRQEPLALSHDDVDSDMLQPLPRSRALVDRGLPLRRRLTLWMVGVAQRWSSRHEPLPEQPTLAQLDKLRKELASVQRRLDRMLG